MDQYKCSVLSIPLESIIPHIEYDKYTDLFALIDYTLPNSSLKDIAIINLLLIHPVIVIRKSHKQFICVAGLRTMNLAKVIFNITSEINAICIEGVKADYIKLLIDTDILVTPMIFSMKSPKNIGHLFNIVPQTNIVRFLSDKINTRCRFARELGYAYNTIFPPSRKEEEI